MEHLRSFQRLLPAVRAYIKRQQPPDWPEFGLVLEPMVEERLGPRPLLPLASCAAAGGDPTEAIPLAAAWEVVFQAGGILDDLQDRDRPHALWATVGDARAFHFSSALQAFAGQLLAEAPWDAERSRVINRMYHAELLRLFAGQDQDLRGDTVSLDDYWTTIARKTAAAFAWACEAGAVCGGAGEAQSDACRQFGFHLGIALQIFDDLQGLWAPLGAGDLACGKVTLPIIYGLNAPHERREELRVLLAAPDAAAHGQAIREILDSIQTRDFMVWAALQERDAGLAALAACPGKAGVAVLTAYATVIFAHLDEVTGMDPAPETAAPTTATE